MTNARPYIDKLFSEKLFTGGRMYRFSKGQVIQSTDDFKSVTLVRKGYVKRYLINNNGSISTQGIYGPGKIFPLTLVYKLLFNQNIYEGHEEYYYEAMTDIQLISIPNDIFVGAVRSNPVIYGELMQIAGNRLNTFIQRLENMSLAPVQNRLAHQLVYYAKNFGEKTKNGTKIVIPFKHHDLAADLDVTRETISHSMKELQKSGLIKTGKFITVPSIKRLENQIYK